MLQLYGNTKKYLIFLWEVNILEIELDVGFSIEYII
jgi:hypothetical protein